MEALNDIKNILTQKNINFKLILHDDIPTVKDAKEKVDFNIDKCYKTIAFKYDERFIFISLKAEDSIDYTKLCSKLNIKRKNLKKADSNELEKLFGYESGGIAPISVSKEIAVIFDDKIKNENVIYCGSGRRNTTIEINAKDLIMLSSAVMDISKVKKRNNIDIGDESFRDDR